MAEWIFHSKKKTHSDHQGPTCPGCRRKLHVDDKDYRSLRFSNFRLGVRAERPAATQIRFAVCTNHFEQHVWQEAPKLSVEEAEHAVKCEEKEVLALAKYERPCTNNMTSLIDNISNLSEMSQKTLWRRHSEGYTECFEMKIPVLPDHVFCRFADPCVHIVLSMEFLSARYGQTMLDQVIAQQDAPKFGWPGRHLMDTLRDDRCCHSDGEPEMLLNLFGPNSMWTVLKWPQMEGDTCFGGRLYVFPWVEQPIARRRNNFPPALNASMYREFHAEKAKMLLHAIPLRRAEIDAKFRDFCRADPLQAPARHSRAIANVAALWKLMFAPHLGLDVDERHVRHLADSDSSGNKTASSNNSKSREMHARRSAFLGKLKAFWHDEYWNHHRHYIMMARAEIPNVDDPTEPRGIRLSRELIWTSIASNDLMPAELFLLAIELLRYMLVDAFQFEVFLDRNGSDQIKQFRGIPIDGGPMSQGVQSVAI